jgi:hypothetical protein
MYKRPFWHFQPEQEPNNEPEVDNMQVCQPIAKPSVSSSLVCKLIKDGDFMPFIGMTQRLGRAEFQICPQWKRGKLVKISIYPLQQEDRSYYYEWEGRGRCNFTIQSYCNLDGCTFIAKNISLTQ